MINKMLFTFLVLMVAFFYAYFRNKKDNKYKFFAFFLILILVIFATFREFIFEDYGTDYFEYKNWFTNMNFSNLNFKYENIGFNLMICIVKSFSRSFYLFLFVYYLIMYILIYKFIDDSSDDKLLSIFIFVCLFLISSYNGMRQWMACAFFCYSLKYVFKHSFIKYAICIFIASTFHITSIALLLVYPALNLKNKVINQQIIIIISGIIMYLNSSLIIQFLLDKSSFLGINYIVKYGNVVGTTSNYTCLIINIFILIALNISYFSEGKKEFNQYIKKVIILTCLSLILCLLSTKSFIFNRFSIYFLTSIMISLPTAINVFNSKSKPFVKFCILGLLLFAFIK